MNQPLSSSSKSSIRIGKFTWPEALSTAQTFNLPDSIIYYITKNPSTPEIYLKLAQSCKYFFEKNSFLVVLRIHGNGKNLCSKNASDCRKIDQKCCVEIDAAKMTNKIWLTNELNFNHKKRISNIASLFSSKFYRCENGLLKIAYCSIAFQDFKLLASKFQRFDFSIVEITDTDGNNIMLESILESIPNVKEFIYSFYSYNPSAATESTMKNILELQNLANLRHLWLRYIPDVINLDDLSDFIYIHKDTKICLYFHRNISEVYRNQLDQLIVNIINSGVSNCLIRYYRQDQEKCKIMSSRFH